MEADEAEKRIAQSGLVIRDEELTGYVHSVLCRTVGEDRCESVRIYVMRVPSFNASMRPNGMMEVWSGLLLRVRNEAELAAVLGHEFAHFELRHSLVGFKNRRKTTDLTAWLSVLGGLLNQSTRDTRISLVGSFSRFNRGQERQADLLGLKYLGQSEYPSRAASVVWQRLMEEEDARLLGRKVKKRRRYKAGFFDSHPTQLDRADYLLDASMKIGDRGDTQSARYYKNLGDNLAWMLKDEILLNQFHGSDYVIGGIASETGWTTHLLSARAEMYRVRGNPRDLVTASSLYLEAIDAGADDPEILRGLGLSLVKTGKRAEAVPYLKRYLERVPDAEDAGIIRFYLPREIVE
ncbi:MAG: M48 family metallopeptidase [Pseudomonadota bacterium]